jgi:hypothetical protein
MRGNRRTHATPIQTKDPNRAKSRRQLERGHEGVDADIQPQHVQLEPFVDGEQDAGKSVKRNLKPGAARRPRKQRAAGQEIFADRIGRQVEAKLGNLAGNVCGERVAVGTRPRRDTRAGRDSGRPRCGSCQ